MKLYNQRGTYKNQKIIKGNSIDNKYIDVANVLGSSSLILTPIIYGINKLITNYKNTKK